MATSSLSLPSSFKYVFVPASGELTEKEHAQVKLGSDEFVDMVKKHFSSVPLPREACIEQLKTRNLTLTPEIQSHIDEGALQYAEITAILLPTKATNFRCISVYSDGNSRIKNLPLNVRASAFLSACGIPTEIFGDVFISRIFDCETVELAGGWWREDFFLYDDFINKTAEWRALARALNSKRGSSTSLTSSLQNMLKASGQSAAQAPPANSPIVSKTADGMRFSETQDCVEVEVDLPEGLKKEDVKVGFKNSWLGVTLKNKPVAMGQLSGRVQVDACTWTLEDSGRRLLISLEKETDSTWGKLWA